MKISFRVLLPLIPITISLIVGGCGPEENKTTSTTSTASSPTEISDSIPHEVCNGNKATYAFPPDSCVGNLVLGNSDCFIPFVRENGAITKAITGHRRSMAYFNKQNSEEMEVFVTGMDAQKIFPYQIIVQKNNLKKNQFPEKHEPMDKYNFISGHGIYITISSAYLMGVYKGQTLVRWQKGDTLYLQYKPQKKDASFFKRYNYEDYSATFKFVNDYLVRMEYLVKPETFEITPHS
jgi:hypothetical protein